MGKNKKKLQTSIVGADDFTSDGLSAPLISIMDRKIRFSFKECELSRKYCISNISNDKEFLKATYKRFGYLENITWGDLRNMSHDKGISIEKKNSANYVTMSKAYSQFSTFGHIRISCPNKPIYRIFGAVLDDLFYILRFDIDGKENH